MERLDGRFDIEVTGTNGFTVQREGFTSVTEADAALRDLRAALSIRRWHLVPQGGPALA
ncbi:hypothetical protein [Methylobacterium tardum]|uniref:hypothetical protein n=1 Tax=Methylobacterium tardum TaxID=374432 RepID=UPI001EDCB663|nr:hypothetical protein [Methylobacterium tardum]URD38145.1 hypothetical protein M6G65_06675 [Methylobacterium tardum]